MEKVLFITLGTNKYATLAKECIESFKQNLKFDSERYKIDYLLLTNLHQLAVWLQLPENVQVRYTQHLPWPLITLIRSHIILGYKELLEDYDYVYFLNSDLRAQLNLRLEELLPYNQTSLVMVFHPGFYKNGKIGTFEYNIKSACCPIFIPTVDTPYTIGALQGGKTQDFIEMYQAMSNMINHDLNINYIPIWHDESAAVKYLNDNLDKFTLLPPNYMQPEGWNSFGPTKILKLSKNHQEIRS